MIEPAPATLSRRTLLSTAVAAVAMPVAGGANAAAAMPMPGSVGVDLAAIDPAVRPGDDFFAYANGRWIARTVIPDDAVGVSNITLMRKANAARVDAIVARAIAAPTTPDERRIGDYQAALLDIATIERRGAQPIRSDLGRVDAVTSVDGLMLTMAYVSRHFPRDWSEVAAPSALMPISPLVYMDITRPSRYRAILVQGGTALPSRDTYTAVEPAKAKLRDAYRTMIATLFALTNRSDGEARAAAVVALEGRLAAAQRSRTELGDLAKRAAIWTRAELATRLPGVDWPAFLTALGFADEAVIGVADPQAFAAVMAELANTPLSVWRDYLAARVLIGFAPFGPAAFVAAHFAYQGMALRGLQRAPARAAYVRPWLDLAMGPAIGAIYLRENRSPDAARALDAMVVQVKRAMGRRIAAVAWMSPLTKRAAFAKLAAVRIDVGGEARPRDYAALVTDRADAWGNACHAAMLDYARNLAKLGRPVDRGEWEMLPYLADAQSNPILVKLSFPAGMMQPPLYDPSADPAANYGALGFFVAHELSHVFDNQGAQFDATGRIHDWWTAADKTRFIAAAGRLAHQVDGYEVLPGLNANGTQTSPENIADLGGVTLALDAYRASLAGRTPPVVAGLTGEQRFFLAYAQLWSGTFREAWLRRQVAVDTHAPARVRASTVRNIDAWYDAFAVRPGDRLYLEPGDRVRIW